MDEQLLIQFLTHTCTSEDLRLVDQWIASGKPNADWLFEMERIWSLKDELRFSDRREIEEAYNRFTLSLGKSKNAKPHFYIYPIFPVYRFSAFHRYPYYFEQPRKYNFQSNQYFFSIHFPYQ